MNRSTQKSRKRNSVPAAQTPFAIVGIGASAGGLEAFTQLLEQLPGHTGLALVLVQHLDPTHESKLTELLARATKLPVVEVRHGMRVETDHVYVIPPNTNMVVHHGVLKLTSRAVTAGRNLPVDVFFRSLAEDRGRRTIGVVLSGTANDGAAGVQAIKVAGGITFAQDEESARYAGMPRQAVATGCVDFVLSPGDIARELVRISRHPYLNGFVEEEMGPSEELLPVFRLLRARTGVDFTHYKPSTIQRRIHRRMALHRLTRLDKYAALLAEKPDEVAALYADLLINVTSFFRDTDVFRAVKKRVFPRLVRAHPNGEPIRVWVPGCATGEEAYSLAIGLLDHLGDRADRIPIQIFATDISEAALAKARAGFFPESIEADLTPAQLRRYFIPAKDGYRVNKSVRELCVFAPHDLVKDPPFSNMDLISCRNVLIYLGPVLQKRVLPMFHYALKPTGFLVLGKAETIGGSANLFTAGDRALKIFSKKPAAARPRFEFARTERPPSLAAARGLGPAAAGEPDVLREADRLLLGRFAPASVLVNDDLEVLQFRGHTGPFLEHEAGAASLKLLKMVSEDVALELRTALNQARKQGTPVRRPGLEVLTDGQRQTVNLEVIPLRLGRARERFFEVLFEEVAPGAAAPAGPVRPLSPQQRATAARLQRELAATKQAQRVIVEELEGANEELTVANEEIQSSNEELQSTNEELETAKEELQSTNEELTTVNEELQNRNTETARLNDTLKGSLQQIQAAREYAEAIIATVREPLVVLDGDLRVQTANAAFYRMFQVTPAETEHRLLYDLGNRQWNIPELRHLLERLLPKNAKLENYRVEHKFQHVGLSTMVLNACRLAGGPSRPALILLAIEDVTVREEADMARARLAAIAESSFDPITGVDLQARITTWNNAAERLYGYTAAEAIGQPISLIIPPDHASDIPKFLRKMRRGESLVGYETVRVCKKGQRHDMAVTISPIRDPRGRIIGSSAIARDITAQKRAEVAVRESTERLQAALVAAHAIAWELDLASGTLRESGPVAEFFGQPAEFQHRNDVAFFESVHPDDRASVRAEIARAIQSAGRDHAAEFRLLLPDGGIRWVATSGSIERDAAGRPIRLRGISRDITVRKQAEENQRRLEQQLLEVTDREQRRIAHDLHDSVGQRLAAVRFMSSTLSKRLAKDKSSGTLAAAQIEQELQHAMDEVRAIARGLHPIRPDGESLMSALHELAAGVTKLFKLPCHFACTPPVAVHDYHAATHLFRIAQEAVSNATRHARAKQIWLRLRRINGGIRLSITDNGRGLPPESNRSEGLGLRIMKYRASVIGATFTMALRRGGGTQIICDWNPGKPPEKAPSHAP